MENHLEKKPDVVFVSLGGSEKEGGSSTVSGAAFLGGEFVYICDGSESLSNWYWTGVRAIVVVEDETKYLVPIDKDAVIPKGENMQVFISNLISFKLGETKLLGAETTNPDGSKTIHKYGE